MASPDHTELTLKSYTDNYNNSLPYCLELYLHYNS